MKIRHMSDLHLEFGPLTLQKVPADVLVLAGDIGVKTQGAEWALKVARDLDIPTVMIAGNHEHYAGHTERGSVQDVIHDCMEIAEKSGGMLHFLEKTYCVIDGVKFIGATMWTDFNLTGTQPQSMMKVRFGMNDYRKIVYGDDEFTPDDALAIHQSTIAYFKKELEDPDFLGKKVVISHHGPSIKSVAGRYAGDDYNAAYVSNLENFVAYSGASLWTHGHVHHSFDYMLGETRVRTNPRGYHGYEESEEFNPNLVTEI